MKYRIVYDYCDDDGYVDERNLVEDFEGTHSDLMDYLRKMRENGCYNIDASAVSDDDEEEAW